MTRAEDQANEVQKIIEKRKKQAKEFTSNPGGFEQDWADLCEQVLAKGKVEVRPLAPNTRIRLQVQFNSLRKSLRLKAPTIFDRYEKIRCFRVPEDGLTFATRHVIASISDFWKPDPEFKNSASFSEGDLSQVEFGKGQEELREKEAKVNMITKASEEGAFALSYLPTERQRGTAEVLAAAGFGAAIKDLEGKTPADLDRERIEREESYKREAVPMTPEELKAMLTKDKKNG